MIELVLAWDLFGVCSRDMVESESRRSASHLRKGALCTREETMRQPPTAIILLGLAVLISSCGVYRGPVSPADCYNFARQQNSDGPASLSTPLTAWILGTGLRQCSPEHLKAGQADAQAARERRQLEEIRKEIKELRRDHWRYRHR